MTVSPVAGGGDALARVQRENETLYAVIKTVSSSLDLDRVLAGIVEIATDATNCHAAFIYFVERDRLLLRAASPQYSHLVGSLGWDIDEGLTGWVARTKTPEFIREHALDDPRMKYVPELEEEHFQSMVAVPVLARDGDVIGVVVLHTRRRASSTTECSTFSCTRRRSWPGAIENAKLFEGTRRRVDALTTLTQLSQAIAAVTLREDLYDAVTRGARQLLGADSCQIWRIDPDADELNLGGLRSAGRRGASRARGAADGADARRPHGRRRGRAPDRPARGGRRAARAALLHGARARFDDEDAELLHAVAHQTSVGLKKAELIERLTAENIVKDMFEALAAGSVDAAEAKAAGGALRPQPAARLPARGARAVAGRGPSGVAGGRRPVREPPAPAVSTRVLRLPPRLGAGDRAAAHGGRGRRGAAAAGLRGACERRPA